MSSKSRVIQHLISRFALQYTLKTILIFKVTGSMTVSMFVLKDLANWWTDMVLLFSVASHMFWDGFVKCKNSQLYFSIFFCWFFYSFWFTGFCGVKQACMKGFLRIGLLVNNCRVPNCCNKDDNIHKSEGLIL